MDYRIKNYRGHYGVFNSLGVLEEECDTYEECEEEINSLIERDKKLHLFIVHYSFINEYDQRVFTHVNMNSKDVPDDDDVMEYIDKLFPNHKHIENIFIEKVYTDI